jgi:hypothetical protein
LRERRIKECATRDSSLVRLERGFPKESRPTFRAEGAHLLLPNSVFREHPACGYDLAVREISRPTERRSGSLLTVVAVADSIEYGIAIHFDEARLAAADGFASHQQTSHHPANSRPDQAFAE